MIDSSFILNTHPSEYSGDKVMNKGELVDKVAEKANVTKKEADAVLSAALETIMEAVSEGDKVTLVGFGSFESRERKAREGRNPKTGQKMTIPETKVPAFSAGKLFKDKVAPNK
jgi:DNA-binding protein HU-beta